MRRFGYHPGLDGVRAMAVALVLLSHSVAHTEGGGLGVNVFFTLSGFLTAAPSAVLTAPLPSAALD